LPWSYPASFKTECITSRNKAMKSYLPTCPSVSKQKAQHLRKENSRTIQTPC
jgi:hypothetical protein